MSTAHIYIYGEIGWSEDKFAKDWGEVNLSDVRDQYEAQKDCEDIIVHIHSNGGVVTTGYAIHDFLRSKKKPITTSIEGMCASIATVIALAGDKRTMTSNSEYMIHLTSGGEWGNSDNLQKAADHIKELDVQASNFYAAKTNLTAETALEMMRAETFMTAEQALEHGFITEIASTMKAVAKFDLKNSKKEDMNKKETESKIDKMLSTMKKLIMGDESPTMKIVQDSTGVEIDFTDLEEDDIPSVDDVATIDGAAAEGEHVMPSGETYVFTAGVLTEIKPSEESEEDESEEMSQLKADNETMKAQAVKDAKALKDLKASMKANEKKVADSMKIIKEMQSEMKTVKASMSSDFDSEEEDGNDRKGGNSTKTRQVFKNK